jgi:nitrogen fixation NifU-like protein
MSRFSSTVMDHFQAPCNRGRLEHASGMGAVGIPGSGPFFMLGIQVVDDRVTAARFECHGCGALVACGSVLTELVIGKDLKSCEEITAIMLTDALDGMPPDKRHCIDTAIQALHKALFEGSGRKSE